jgi:hypothetical protein
MKSLDLNITGASRLPSFSNFQDIKECRVLSLLWQNFSNTGELPIPIGYNLVFKV